MLPLPNPNEFIARLSLDASFVLWKIQVLSTWKHTLTLLTSMSSASKWRPNIFGDSPGIGSILMQISWPLRADSICLWFDSMEVTIPMSTNCKKKERKKTKTIRKIVKVFGGPTGRMFNIARNYFFGAFIGWDFRMSFTESLISYANQAYLICQSCKIPQRGVAKKKRRGVELRRGKFYQRICCEFHVRWPLPQFHW